MNILNNRKDYLSEFDKDIMEICNLLKIDYSIVKENIYFGDEAVSQISKNTNLTEEEAKKNRGMFLYLNKEDGQVLENPLICIVNVNKGTLAHELCHYKQFLEKDENLLKVNYILENDFYKKYLKDYPNYPCEKEAFDFAVEYLRKSEAKFLKFKYSFNYKSLKLDYYIKNKFKSVGAIFG